MANPIVQTVAAPSGTLGVNTYYYADNTTVTSTTGKNIAARIEDVASLAFEVYHPGDSDGTIIVTLEWSLDGTNWVADTAFSTITTAASRQILKPVKFAKFYHFKVAVSVATVDAGLTIKAIYNATPGVYVS